MNWKIFNQSTFVSLYFLLSMCKKFNLRNFSTLKFSIIVNFQQKREKSILRKIYNKIWFLINDIKLTFCAIYRTLAVCIWIPHIHKTHRFHRFPSFSSRKKMRAAHKRHTLEIDSDLDQRGSVPVADSRRAREDASQAIAGDLRDRECWDRSARLSSMCA